VVDGRARFRAVLSHRSPWLMRLRAMARNFEAIERLLF